MNPGTLNRRITFTKLTHTTNEYGGSTPVYNDVLTTWASKQPIRTNNQFAIEAGASVLNDDVAFIIRFRRGFTPEKDMEITESGNKYVIAAVKTYQEKVSTGFQTGNAVVYHDSWYLYIIGIRQNNGSIS